MNDSSTPVQSVQPQNIMEAYIPTDNYLSGENETVDNSFPAPSLRTMLKQQLEFYFSRENLASDSYLLSQMDSDQFVPISTVANFNQIRRLTNDLNLITDVLRESPNVQVDQAGERVRPNYKRCVLILREIPKTMPVKEIEALFAGENCPKFLSCEFAHNDSWYITFESNEDAQKAYRYLREEVRTFHGKPIMARIKAKPVTSAPFIIRSKNGYGQCVDGNMNEQLLTAQVQQHQESHLQRYAYTNPGSLSYDNQLFPPFYPPTVLQAWTPANSACLDLGTVYPVNGLPPQPSFKPYGNSGRHNIRGRASKSYNRGQYSYSPEPRSRFFDQRDISFMQQPQPASASLLRTGFTYVPYTLTSHNPYGFGMDIQEFFTFPKQPDSHMHSFYSHYNTHNRQGSSAITGFKGGTRSTSSLSSKDCSEQESFSPVSYTLEPRVKNAGAQPQRSWAGQKKKEEFNQKVDNGNNMEEKFDATDFDFEATSFPPLPGSKESPTAENNICESHLSTKMGAVVKPPMRDNKTQTELSPPTEKVNTKDSSTLTNDLLQEVPTSPVSPEVEESAHQVVVDFCSQGVQTSEVEDTGWNENLDEETMKIAVTCLANVITSERTASVNASTSFENVACFMTSPTATVISDVKVKSSVTSVKPISVLKNSDTSVTSIDTVTNDVASLVTHPVTLIDSIIPKDKHSVISEVDNCESVTKNASNIITSSDTALDIGVYVSSPVTIVAAKHSSSSCSSTSSSSPSSRCPSPKTTDYQSHPQQKLNLDILDNSSISSTSKLPDISHQDNKYTKRGITQLPQTIQEPIDKGRKLTYSEVAQRAKDRVEKLAQEIKERERQEAMVRQQRHINTLQNKQQFSAARGVSKEILKPRSSDYYNLRYNEKKTGRALLSKKDRFRRVTYRSTKEDKNEINPFAYTTERQNY
ncbi:uncharacterized protein LOC106458360 isoform X1 [Limulus polyphemus]|uniref:Uncharacterized protein LOC106458360 isoform X1 n=1 Tax=Limulus polyphemus TaxID=6850 RepID=A0ABM1S9F3_LIMPO|nr:uncharacterized protein LOC106458360 isoform X1 [Limulus polyphemus]XP_022240258.1 uncharacterized protein LOC106458360 isoform X1 [Limulus polyphemus]XP_022240259.1 uncharacterized protein LOC106458360 isoform X1 [Limulus polyphemus]